MSEPIKLRNAGDAHTMDVVSCEKLSFGTYPEYEFTGKDGSKVRVPEKSAIRQLERLELTSAAIVGKRVTIKRDPNSKDPKKPFWGVYLEESGANGAGGASSGATVGERTPRAESINAPTTTPASLHGYKLYTQIIHKVLADMPPLFDAAGVPLDGQTVAAITATIFIQAERRA